MLTAEQVLDHKHKQMTVGLLASIKTWKELGSSIVINKLTWTRLTKM